MLDISVILNCHREGEVVVATINSMAEAVKVASTAGLAVEIIIVLDGSDEQTKAAVASANLADHARIIETLHFDLGMARNSGVELAHGVFTALLDADDLWSDNWLIASAVAARADPRMVVWHPQTNIMFGEDSYIYPHIDMENPEFEMEWLAIANYWTSLCFTRTESLRQLPFRPRRPDLYRGFEDWSWYLESLHHGLLHKIVPQTCHAIRRKRTSLSADLLSGGAVPYPSLDFTTQANRYPGTVQN